MGRISLLMFIYSLMQLTTVFLWLVSPYYVLSLISLMQLTTVFQWLVSPYVLSLIDAINNSFPMGGISLLMFIYSLMKLTTVFLWLVSPYNIHSLIDTINYLLFLISYGL